MPLAARLLRSSGLALAAVLLSAPAAQAALSDAGGDVIPGTDWSSPTAQVLGAPACADPVRAAGCVRLAEPGSPEDDAADARGALGASSAPEDDLLAELEALAAAPDVASALRARDVALAILEGDPLPGRAYSGIPLLNWNAPAKVKTVPAGGEAIITQVRTPGHTLSDAWLLRFEDPQQPYTIRYRLGELGGTFGGQLQPTPLLADGEQGLGGLTSALVPLTTPSLSTGTKDWSRFTRGRGIPAPGAAETTRLGLQEVVVSMPPPGVTRAVLHPSDGAHGPSLHTLAPASSERLATAAAALGFSGGAPTPAERRAAIGRLAAAAPERQIWSDLLALPDTSDDGFLAAARTAGEGTRVLVGPMRRRDSLPAGVLRDPDADVTLVLQNNEAYVSRTRVRAGDSVRVQIVNRDGFEHSVDLVGLTGRRPVHGAEDWGRFDWNGLGATTRVPAGISRTVERDLPEDAFVLVAGDSASGDQATAVVELERGPRIESVSLGGSDSAAPLHAALDGEGALWATLTGIDKVVRVQPGADLDAAAQTTVLMPGGAHAVTSDRPPLEPADVAVDERGIVWVTLVLGNAIARIDPAAIEDGTDAGVRLYPLPPCGEDECAAPFAGPALEAPSREPLQMEVTSDAEGNTVVWFSEAAAGRIGALRVDPAGRRLNQVEFSCGCEAPLGLALDAAGDVWFTEAVENRLGRLTPGTTEPFTAGAARLQHYVIPSAVRTMEPEISRTELLTSLPHSVAIDARGLVWATESATGKLAVLDPAAARPGTSDGFTEIDLPHNDFKGAPTPADLTIDRAGKVFWTDEYGDAVGVVDATSGPSSSLKAAPSIRPVARRSLTDSPLLSPDGDLYFIESAANRLTRVSGVSAGAPAPAAPPTIEFATGTATVAISGMREAASVDIRVMRDGRTAAQALGIPVDGGQARVAASQWSGAQGLLRAGDVVQITPRGVHARATLEHEIPALTAAAALDGSVTGTARKSGQALFGRVAAGENAQLSAAIDGADGGFAFPAPQPEASSPQVVSWTAATPGARYRTVAAVTPAPRPGPGTDSPAQDPGPAQSTGSAPTPAATPAPVSSPAKPVPAACLRRQWLTGTPPRARTPWIGMRGADVERCVGAPARRLTSGRVQVWHHAGGLVLELRSGRVSRAVLTGGAWSSARGGLRVGAPARTIRSALTFTAGDGTRGRRAVLALDGARAVDVRIALTRDRRRVARIVLAVVDRTNLDRGGRMLLEAQR